jgi:phosphotransferase system enzyme I (PtsI)
LEVSVSVRERAISRDEIASEIARLDRALASTDVQLERLERELLEREGSEGYEIVQAHRLMLKSAQLVGATRRRIQDELLGAEWALRQTLDGIQATFTRIDDVYLRERGADVEALGDRILRALCGLPEARLGAGAPVGGIAVGIELSPHDPFQLKAAGIVGIASDGGGKTSHTAILARAFGLPYVVGVPHLSQVVHPGDTLIVDGGTGEVVVNPDQETQLVFERRAEAARARTERLDTAKLLPAVTVDGHAIQLAANIESLSEIAAVVEVGATAVGLFRTEFLYLERLDLPTEEEQYEDAVAVLRELGGRPATFRTLDLGGDKLVLALTPPKGPNPALGVRSIRLSLQRRDIFRTQLRALYRAAAVGPLRIMFPLISGVTELAQARAVCREVGLELEAQGVPYGRDIAIGAMIETPSAALTIDHLARECDFFSIGTNDLIQYAFAADRENDEVGHLYHPLHPAVLRLLKQIVDAARTANKPVSLCGDMAGDAALTWILLGLGFTDLSMAPRQIPAIKAVIRASSLADATDLANLALTLGSEVEVEALVRSVMRDRFGSEYGDSLDLPAAALDALAVREAS